MPRLELTWTWKLSSPAHFGTGLSRPGRADRLILRDRNDQPWISGDLIKGALRMSAEQVAVWLGASQEQAYGEDQPWEPVPGPMACAFGANMHVSPGTHIENAGDRVLLSTAIDPARGAAKEKTLRSIEVMSGKDVQFDAAVFMDVPAEQLDATETLIVASLTATEQVGGKAGIGWGRVSLTKVSLTADSNPRDHVVALAPERLQVLKESLTTGASSDAAKRTPRASRVEDDNSFIWRRLDITLLEPACFASRPAVANHVATDLAVPATSLRGALWHYWSNQNENDDRVLAWLAAGTRWSPGFPVIDGVLCVPAPRSLMAAKGEAGSGPVALVDTLRNERPPRNQRTGTRPVLRPLKNAWIRATLDYGDIVVTRPVKATRMHLARDYWTGSKRQGALYSRETLEPAGARFVAWARLPPCVLEAGRFKIMLGKRKSAGHGLAEVEVTPGAIPDVSAVPARTSEESSSQNLYVQLLSPALVLDEFGYPRRAVPPEQLIRLAGLESLKDVSVAAADPHDPSVGSAVRSAAGRRGGWMMPWGHQRAAVTTIEAGSVWRLGINGPGVRPFGFRGMTQIGDRLHEGFGWVAIEPSWIRDKNVPLPEATLAQPQPPMPAEGQLPHRWPGMPGLQAAALDDSLRSIVRSLNAMAPAPSADAHAVLQQIAAKARVVSSTDSANALRLFCRNRATERPRPGRWKHLAEEEPIGRFLNPYWPQADAGPASPWAPDLLRFALEALLIRTATMREGNA